MGKIVRKRGTLDLHRKREPWPDWEFFRNSSTDYKEKLSVSKNGLNGFGIVVIYCYS